MSADRIVLTGVRARGHHGVFDHEKRDGQDFVVDVVLHLDLAAAARTDDLDATVSYAVIAAEVVARIEGEPLDLIEALAGQIAEDALRHARVDRVEVTVHKPQAPVGVAFGDVAVTVERGRRSRVVVALGSNLGRSPAILDAALDALAEVVEIDGQSGRYRTDPVGGPEQPDYLNAVVTGTTELSAWSLLARMQAIEAGHGRTREVRWGPRTLDLDLVAYGTAGGADELRQSDPDLTLPHPRAHERAFVLVPWLDADPGALLRVGDDLVPVAELVPRLDTSGVRSAGERPC